MRRRHRWFAILTTAIGLLAVAAPAHATWSVIGADPDTGEVGVAVASCVPGEVVVVPVLVPGVGAAASQAALNPASGDQLVTALQSGQPAEQVIASVTSPAFDPMAQQRQFGTVTLNGTSAGFTGSSNPSAALSAQNASNTASVQGNTLAGDAVVNDALAAFDATDGPLADRLLAALTAGSEAGGDSRCGSRTASSAALIVAQRDDPVWNATSAGFTVDVATVPTPSTYVSVVPAGAQNAVYELTDAYQEARQEAGPGQPIKVSQVPWMLSTLGIPPMFAMYAGVALLAVVAIVVAVVWLIRRSRARRA